VDGILKLYKQNTKLTDVSRRCAHIYWLCYKRVRPSSVIVIGHSMGAVVTLASLGLANYVPGSINTIIALNSPIAYSQLTLLFCLCHTGVLQFLMTGP
jgi:hypothetical protein